MERKYYAHWNGDPEAGIRSGYVEVDLTVHEWDQSDVETRQCLDDCIKRALKETFEADYVITEEDYQAELIEEEKWNCGQDED